MAYVPDPNDATHPTDAEIAETAAPEFRALKAKVNTLAADVVTGTGVRNILANGDMTFDLTHGGVLTVSIPLQTYAADCWKFGASLVAVFNSITDVTKADVPVGYTNKLSMIVQTIHAVLAAADFFIIQGMVEGFSMRHMSYGTGGAKASTLLFWAKSSVTGQHCVSIRNGGGTRSFVHPFQIPVANVWTRYAVTIPGDTVGPWATDSSLGATVNFNLGCGATFIVPLGQENSWSAGNFLASTGSVNVCAAVAGNSFQFTGVEWKDGVYTIGDPQEVLPFSLMRERITRFLQIRTVFVPSLAANVQYVPYVPSMRIAPAITGGGAGFLTSGNSVDGVNMGQTVGTNQLLTFDARL